MVAPPDSFTFTLPDETTAVIKVRVNRRAKRLRLRVEHDGDIVLVLPSMRRWPEGRGFLQEQAIWLASHLRTVARSTPFQPGEVIPFLGADHVLRHTGKLRGIVVCEDEEILVSGQPEHFARRLNDWLKQQARDELSTRARGYASQLDKPVGRVTVRDTKSRWGS